MPKSILMLMEAPFASGVPSVIVPDDHVELNAPPLGCDGGCSNVVPCTLTVQGVVATPLEARQVTASLIPKPLSVTTCVNAGRQFPKVLGR